MKQVWIIVRYFLILYFMASVVTTARNWMVW